MRLLATAGHVDHGKSTLVRALTGMEPDRFHEEQRRGLTIDLGFAWFTVPSGEQVAVVDVPGHVRFIRNLLAGVGAVEGVLFVVSAAEGWMPQSEEHLRILECVGVDAGVAVVTNAHRVEPELAELACLEVSDRLARSSLASARVVLVDSLDRTGLDDLVTSIEDLIATRPPPEDRGRPRLWIDRSFTMRGSGTVVTGTLTSGRLQADAPIEIVAGDRSRRPATATWSREVLVRGLQSLGAAVSVAGPGSRVALNLRHIERRDVARGDAAILPGQWHRCARFDADLVVVPDHPQPVTRRGAYLAYLGSGEHSVRLEVIGGREVQPGAEGLVRLVLPTELPLVPGDRYVLRDAGRNLTVGGGTILDVDPTLPLSRAKPSRSVDRVLEERGWLEVDELERLTGERRAPSIGRWVYDEAVLTATRQQVVDAVARAGPVGLDVASLDERERQVLAIMPELEIAFGQVRPRGAADPVSDHPWLTALRTEPFRPPPPSGIPRDEIAALTRRGAVVEAGGIYFAAEAIDEARDLVAAALRRSPEGITMAALRDLLGATRKYALAIGMILDQRAITVRRGDVRLAGPALRPAHPPAGSAEPDAT